jgi:hypothetical protein
MRECFEVFVVFRDDERLLALGSPSRRILPRRGLQSLLNLGFNWGAVLPDHPKGFWKVTGRQPGTVFTDPLATNRFWRKT